MTNKERYRITDKFVKAIKKLLDNQRRCMFVELKAAIEEFCRFCEESDCRQCTFYKSNEECFIQWLNAEVGK